MMAFKIKFPGFLSKEFAKLINSQQSDHPRTYLLKGAIGTFGIMVTGMGLSLVTTVLLARILEPTDFGIYKYVMAWVGLLSIPASLGSGPLIVREVATFQAKANWGLLRGILRWSNIAVFITSITIGLIASFVSWFFISNDLTVRYTVVMAMLLLPISNLVGLRQSAIRGLNHVLCSQLLEKLLDPILFFLSFLILYTFFRYWLNPICLVGMKAAISVVVLIVGSMLLHSVLPPKTFRAIPAYQVKRWVKSIISFTLTSGLHTINRHADLIMVGALMGMNAAGVYAVVSYGAVMIKFIIIATNTAISPTAAKLYTKDNQQRLQWITTMSARLVFISSLLLCSVLIVFGRKFLLIFGPDFTRSFDAFLILTVGRTVQISMGLSGMLLNMTGYERETAIGTTLGAVLNIVLNAVLIPVWGLEGAACATVIGGLSTVILLNYRCGLRLGIKPSIFNTLKMDLKSPGK